MDTMRSAAARAAEAAPAGVPRIDDYAAIGDCRSVGLIGAGGALEWLCWPHYSSPSVFGALLDAERGGAWRIAPLGHAERTRRYWPDTNVLETSFATPSGALRLIDAMPLPRSPRIGPMREVLRTLEGLRGETRVAVSIDPRPGYGLDPVRLEARGPGAWMWLWNSEALLLQTDVPLVPQGTALRGEFSLRAGERRHGSLSYAAGDIAVMPGIGAPARARLAATADWWRTWARRARYAGPHRAAVLRSALLLKLLCCTQSGAVIAAATTSLPEWPGGRRNWDYRYCWLRDAALTMRALVDLGFFDEARAFLDWLLHATRLTWPRLRVLYDLYGRADLAERTLPHLRGFRGSRPVRIGNGAMVQDQLDVYGAVCFAARAFVDATGQLRRDEARLLRGLGAEVLRRWREPDHGIWEIRGPPRQYTFSKMMCALALDSLVHLAHGGHRTDGSAFASAAHDIRAAISTHGYHRVLDSYVATFDGAAPDASILLAGCLGYEPPRAAAMRGTLRYLRRTLEHRGLLHRYAAGFDGDASPEGAFPICSLAAVDHLAQCGETRSAEALMARVLSCANDVGLLAEEIDPDRGEMLGNFPQAYTHVGVISAALSLEHARSGAPP